MAGFREVTFSLLEGFAQNCQIFLYTLLVALPLGLIITFGSMAKFKPIKYLTKAFVWVIRGTPLMLQLFIVMYVPGIVFDIKMPSSILGIDQRMFCALIAFIINYAAYFSEIFRGGIESIPKGQYEAGQVLGMTKTNFLPDCADAGCKTHCSAAWQRGDHFSEGYISCKNYCRIRSNYDRGAVCRRRNHMAAILHRGILSAVLRGTYVIAFLYRKETRLL